MTNQKGSNSSEEQPRNLDARGQESARGRRRSSGQNSTQRGIGRNIYRNEDQQITLIWANLSENSRLRLIQRLVSMSNLSLAVRRGSDGPNPSSIEDGMEHAASSSLVDTNANANLPQRRVRVWERPIIRDVALFRAFSEMRPSERRRAVNGEWSVPQLLSISTGAIARATRLRNGVSSAEPTDRQILAAINENINDGEALRSLYVNAPPRDGAQDEQQIPAGDPAHDLNEEVEGNAEPVIRNDGGDNGEERDLDADPPDPPDANVGINDGASASLNNVVEGVGIPLQVPGVLRAPQFSAGDTLAVAAPSQRNVTLTPAKPKKSWAQECETPDSEESGNEQGGDSTRRQKKKRKRTKKSGKKN